ncbi:MAG: diguanylate cyclase [Planctomycetota bacterium]
MTVSQYVEADNIPSPPGVAAKLLEISSRSDFDIDEIRRTLSADPKLSARLIEYCNSPLVGAQRRISSLEQATVVLGMRTVRLLSLSFSLMDTRGGSEFDFDGYWRSSLANAIAAKVVSKQQGEGGDEAFLLGLVANIGLVCFGVTKPSELNELLQRSPETSSDEEVATFGVNRFEVASALLQKWSFPTEMTQTLDRMAQGEDGHDCGILKLADLISTMILAESSDPERLIEVKGFAAADPLNIDGENFSVIMDEVFAEWSNHESLFQFDPLAITSLAQLETQAKSAMVQISLGLEHEIQQASAEVDRLQECAYTDALSNVNNRKAYEELLPKQLTNFKDRNESFGFIAVDIDHFKRVNDTYGHAAGDEVIRRVAEVLKDQTHRPCEVFRYGGEEFVFIAPADTPDDLKTFADQKRIEIESQPVQSGELHMSVTASFGCSFAAGGNYESIGQLFDQADKALYEAKQNGRNQVQLSTIAAAAASS